MRLARMFAPDAPRSVVLIRLAVGGGSMLLGSLFLLLVGAGPWSLDALLHRRIGGRG